MFVHANSHFAHLILGLLEQRNEHRESRSIAALQFSTRLLLCESFPSFLHTCWLINLSLRFSVLVSSTDLEHISRVVPEHTTARTEQGVSPSAKLRRHSVLWPQRAYLRVTTIDKDTKEDNFWFLLPGKSCCSRAKPTTRKSNECGPCTAGAYKMCWYCQR